MALWDWISGYVLPLFGELPNVSFDLGHLGTLTIENMIQIMFWLSIGYVVVNILIFWPYKWFNKLLHKKG